MDLNHGSIDPIFRSNDHEKGESQGGNAIASEKIENRFRDRPRRRHPVENLIAILRMILRQKGDIAVEGDEVRICLEKFDHPTYQRVSSSLCKALNTRAKILG